MHPSFESTMYHELSYVYTQNAPPIKWTDNQQTAIVLLSDTKTNGCPKIHPIVFFQFLFVNLEHFVVGLRIFAACLSQ